MEKAVSTEYSSVEQDLISGRDSLSGLPPPFRDAWVIYVDIEGFSRLMSDPVRRAKLAHIYWDLAGSLLWGSRPHRVLSASMKAAGAAPEDVQRTLTEKLDLWRSRLRVFSDSIFIFLDPSRLSGVAPSDFTLDGNLVPDVAAQLSRLLWQDGLPHRGGIAHGSCFIDPARNVFLGDPIVRAVGWAAKQQWFGISVEPSSIQHGVRDFVNAPFVASGCTVPVASGCEKGSVTAETTTAISCFPADDRRDGPTIGEEPALDGLLRAYEAALGCAPHVRDRYVQTGRIWHDRFGVDGELNRYRELVALAGR
jgi:hypothetical protein